jgi:putative membrane protein
MGADMQDLAIRKNITLPADMTNEQKRDLEKLNEKTGLDFDKEYAKQMENKHEDAVKTLEKISDKSEDAEFRQWAEQSIPEIRSHLDMVKSTKENIKDMKDDARASGVKNGRTKGKASNDY